MEVPKTEILVTVAGRTQANVLFDPGEYVFGSGDGCHVRFHADDVSARHAKLTINFDSILIEDLGSSSGTHVNGKRVSETTRLWPNQKIQLGTATITLRRLKTGSSPDNSIAPQTAVVRRVLPEEFLRDKKYDIGGVVAQGGMGAILDAKEATTARTVAMKVMLDTNSPEVLMRFITEAKITAQLEHPGIVPVYELSVDENEQVFYTMKFVRGVTLKNIVESLAAGDAATLAKYPLVVLVTIFQKVCDAIAFAHSKGIIHRDLKPENVMIGDYGEVLVMDWGLAKVLDPQRAAVMLLPPQPAPPRPGSVSADSDRTVLIPAAGGDHVRDAVRGTGAGMTMEGAILGTPQFMAPEQAAGLNDQLDQRADIYSLGAILCQLLTLRPPVEGTNIDEVLHKVARGEIAWPATFTSGAKRLPHLPFGKVPDSLNAIVKEAMSLKPDDRYPSVVALQTDLVAYQNGFATSVEHAGMWKQMKLLVKRNRGTSVAAAAGLIILAIASAIFTIRVIRERDRATAGELAATQQRDAAEKERMRAEINAEAAKLVNLAQTDPEEALIRSVVNVEKCRRTLGEVTAPVAYGLTAALERYRFLGTVPLGWAKVCAWAPSARLLASFNKRVWLSDLDRNATQAETLRFQNDPIEHLAVTSDGKRIALAGNDTEIRIWNPTDDKATRTWKAHAEWLRAVAFSDDDTLLFSVSADGSLKTWDLEGAEAAPEAKLEMDGQKIGVAAIGDSGSTVVAVGDSPFTTQAQIFLRDNPSAPIRRITVSGHASRITAAAVSGDGERIATGDGDGTIRVWSREGKLVGGPSQIHRGLIETITFDPGGDCIASREGNGNAFVSTTEGIVLHGPFPTNGGRNLACTGDGRLIVDSQVLDLLGLESAPALNIGTTILDLTRSQDGSLFGAIDDSGTVRVWKFPSRELVSETVIAPGRGKLLSISPDSKLIAASLLAEDTIHFIRPDGTKAHAPLQIKGDEPAALRFHTPTGRLIIATTSGSLLSFDPAKDDPPALLSSVPPGMLDRPLVAGLDATRETVLVGFRGKNSKGFVESITADGRSIARLTPATGAPAGGLSYPNTVDISPGGDSAYLLGNDALQIRAFPSLGLVGSFPVKIGWPTGTFALASLSGGHVAIGNGEGDVRVLNAAGEPVTPWLVRDRKPALALLFDAAHDDLIASGREGRIRFWETSEKSWMAQAARKLSHSERIRRAATPLDSEAARIIAAHRTEPPRFEFQRARKSTRGAAPVATVPDAPGLTRVAGAPFAMKIPDGWVAADALKIAFVDKLIRTIIFKERGREVSLLTGFHPKDASILQLTGGGEISFMGLTRLNGGKSPAELGVFARRAKDMAENTIRVIGSVNADAATNREGILTSWNDAAATAVIDFKGKTNSGQLMLGRGYYILSRQGTYVLAAKFTGDSAPQSMAELDRSVAAIQFPEALRVDAAFRAGFRKEIEAIAADEGIDSIVKQRDRMRDQARKARDENKLTEAADLMEKAAAICADLVEKRPAETGRWTLEHSKTLEEEAGFFAGKDRHTDALPIAERALEKAADAMQRLASSDARLNLARCHIRKAVSAAALKKLPEAAASFEAAILLLREDADKTGDPGRLRLAVDTAMKLADVLADSKDADALAKTFESAAADVDTLAGSRIKDAFEILPGLLDKMQQRRAQTAAAGLLGGTFPKLIAAAEGPAAAGLPPEVLVSALKSSVRLAELAQANPGGSEGQVADLCRIAEKIGERLTANGPLSANTELWLSGARTLTAPLRTFPIARDPKATEVQLDLTAHYNGDLDRQTFGSEPRFTLRALPAGLQTLDGMLFDIRGIAQVTGNSFPKNFTPPDSIRGIAVGQQVRRLHVLHGCRWAEKTPDTRIGTYLLHYEDGQNAELPIHYGRDVRDWSASAEKGQATPNASLAWIGYGGTEGLRIFHRAYDNPRPGVKIVSMDLVSAKEKAAPFVIAITVE